jgi:hypothetical protein
MKRRLSVILGLNKSAFESFRQYCAHGEAGNSATRQAQLPYHPRFEAASLRLSAKILRGWRDFRARFIGLMPKTQG